MDQRSVSRCIIPVLQSPVLTSTREKCLSFGLCFSPLREEKHNPSAEHVFAASSESLEHVAGLEAGDSKKFAIA